MPADHEADALAALDRLLAEKPEKVGHDFSAATRRLCVWRDRLVERWRQTRAENDRRDLERVNAAISVIVGGQFPLGNVPWPEIEKIRNDLGTVEHSRSPAAGERQGVGQSGCNPGRCRG